MKRTINKDDFRKAFKDANREDQFSYYALGLIFDYFTELEEETGEQIELDVVAICCDYVEFENVQELKKDYEIPSDLSNDKIIDYLNERTQVVCFEKNCILIQRY